MKKIVLIVGLLGIVSQNATGSDNPSLYNNKWLIESNEIATVFTGESADKYVNKNSPNHSIVVSIRGVADGAYRNLFSVPSSLIEDVPVLKMFYDAHKKTPLGCNKICAILDFVVLYKTQHDMFPVVDSQGKKDSNKSTFPGYVAQLFKGLDDVVKEKKAGSGPGESWKTFSEFRDEDIVTEQKAIIYNLKLMQLPLFGSLNLGDVFEPGMLSWLKIHQVKVVFASGLIGLLALLAQYRQ